MFNVPQEVRGDAIVDVPCSFYNLGSATTEYLYIIAKIRKWDGTIETDIAEGSSPVWTASTQANLHNYNMRTAKVIVPATHFKRGEYLRLTVEAWAKGTVANNDRVVIGHDPANRSGMDGELYNRAWVSGATILKLQLPLRIDT